MCPFCSVKPVQGCVAAPRLQPAGRHARVWGMFAGVAGRQKPGNAKASRQRLGKGGRWGQVRTGICSGGQARLPHEGRRRRQAVAEGGESSAGRLAEPVSVLPGRARRALPNARTVLPGSPPSTGPPSAVPAIEYQGIGRPGQSVYRQRQPTSGKAYWQ